MSRRRYLGKALASLLAISLVVAFAGGSARAVTFVHLDGQDFLETGVPDTVTITADCAQPGNRLKAEIYLDLNDNGVVDGNEMTVRFVYLNDGIPTLENQSGDEIPGDDDAQLDGQLHYEMELLEEDYSFSTVPIQFIIEVTDEDHSMARAILRILPAVPGKPYIGGTVTDAVTAAPVDSMAVVAYQTDTDDYRATLCDDQGHYVLNVDAGEWNVLTWDLQNYYAPADTQTITVAADDSVQADFVLSPFPAYITGKVDSSGASPVPGVMVAAIDTIFNTWVGWTQADGHYRIGVIPGTYDVYPLFLPSGYASQPASYLNVVVDSGETIAGRNFMLGRPTSRFEGRVTYLAGEGASGITVRAFSVGGYNYTTLTDESGDYSLAVIAGNYILSAEFTGYQVVSPVTGIYFPVIINLGQTLTGYDFVINPVSGGPASISGTVTYRATGQPAGDVYVVIYNEEELSSQGWHFSETDAAGQYEFGDIIDGTWLVGIYQVGYQSDPLLREATVMFSVSAPDQDFELVTSTAVPEGQQTVLPGRSYLLPNRPNPFNAETLIAYSLAGEMLRPVTLKIYNVVGQEVCTLVDEPQSGGLKLATWSGRSSEGLAVSSGIYFCELQVGSLRQIRKLVLVR